MSYSLWAGSGRNVQDQDATSWSCSQAVWHIPLLCIRWKTPDDGQRNCLKHVEFYSKNKFEKFAHLFGFIIRIYHDARSPECHICTPLLLSLIDGTLSNCTIPFGKHISTLRRTVICTWVPFRGSHKSQVILYAVFFIVSIFSFVHLNSCVLFYKLLTIFFG